MRLALPLGLPRELAWHAMEYAELCRTETRISSPDAIDRAYFYASTSYHQGQLALDIFRRREGRAGR